MLGNTKDVEDNIPSGGEYLPGEEDNGGQNLEERETSKSDDPTEETLKKLAHLEWLNTIGTKNILKELKQLRLTLLEDAVVRNNNRHTEGVSITLTRASFLGDIIKFLELGEKIQL